MQNIILFISSEVDCMNGVSTEMSQKFKEIYEKFRKNIQENILNKNNYGDAIGDEGCIGIIMTLYSKKFLNEIIQQTGKEFKERRMYMYKDRDSDIRLRVDYEKYLAGDESTREKLILKNIVDSILALDEQIKKHKDVTFKGEQLAKDICEHFNFNPKSI